MGFFGIIFIFFYYSTNIILSKVFFIKISQFGTWASLISIVTYCFFSAISTSVVKYMYYISFRAVSVIFLFNLLTTTQIALSNSFFYLLIFNIIRAYLMGIFASINFSILLKSITNQDSPSQKKLVVLVLLITVIISFCIPKIYYEPFLFVNNTVAFILFFMTGKDTEVDLQFKMNLIASRKNVLVKVIFTRFINSLLIAFLKPANILKISFFLFLITKSFFMFLFKSIAFLILIWNLISNFEKSYFFFSVHLISKYIFKVDEKFFKISQKYIENKHYSLREAYKLFTGQENSATYVAENYSTIDKITNILSNLF